MDRTRINLGSTSSAFAASSGSPRASQNASSSSSASSTSSSASNSHGKGSSRPKCDFCSRLGHIEAKCFLKEKLMRQIALPSSSSASPAFTQSQSSLQVVPEAPQSASIASASSLFSAATPDAHFSSWNADTGSSAHITFNRHWMRNLVAHRIPICLADGSVIHSEGVGSVQFRAVVNG